MNIRSCVGVYFAKVEDAKAMGLQLIECLSARIAKLQVLNFLGESSSILECSPFNYEFI